MANETLELDSTVSPQGSGVENDPDGVMRAIKHSLVFEKGQVAVEKEIDTIRGLLINQIAGRKEILEKPHEQLDRFENQVISGGVFRLRN